MKKLKILSLLLAATLCVGLALPAAAYDVGTVGVRTSVYAESYITAVIDINDTLWMCGSGGYRMGNGTIMSHTDVPVKVLDNVASVGIADDFTAAVTTDGSLWTWGETGTTEADKGQLGYDTQWSTRDPVKVLDNVAAVSCGSDHGAAIKTDGSLWMWGGNTLGQLGNGTLTNSTYPVKVMDDVVSVSCGYSNTAVIKSDGSLWMWGCNNSGQLGNGWTGNARGQWNFLCQTTPIKIMDDVVAVSCGNATAAIKTDGSLWMWGINSSGELGNGMVGNDKYNGHVIQTTPIKVMEDVVAVNCGAAHTGAIKSDGSLWMWGENRYGQLGNGLVGDYEHVSTVRWFNQTVPMKVMDDVAAVSCGYTQTAAIKTDGTLWMWGMSSMLGNGGVGNEVRNEYPDSNSSGITCQTVPVRVMDSIVLPKPATVTTSTSASPTVAGFTDVHESDYYAQAVAWAKENGVTSGTSTTTFSPAATVTRAEAVTFLWRAAGSPEPSTKTSPFTDVADSGAYYYKAVLWAAEQGITSGVSSTTFGLNNKLTYDQILTFLCRAAGKSASGSDWSATAVNWAKENGLTDGLTFTAKGSCPRADVVYCLWKQLA